jgi:WD40 repeat protein
MLPGTKEIIREVAHHQLRSDRVARCISPDSQTLAVTCGDGSLRIWHPITGLNYAIFGPLGKCGQRRISPEGNRLLLQVVITRSLWNLTAEPKRPRSNRTTHKLAPPVPMAACWRLPGARTSISAAAASRSISGTSANRITAQLNGHRGWLTSVEFSPQGDTVLSGATTRQPFCGSQFQQADPYPGPPPPSRSRIYPRVSGSRCADHTIKIWNAKPAKKSRRSLVMMRQ